MAQLDPWWVLVALTGCAVAASVSQGLYFGWRLRSLGRMLKAPRADDGATVGAGDLVGGLLLTSARLDATLREARHAQLQRDAPVAGEARYRLGRDMAAAGATAAKIAEVCGMTPCEAELVQSVHAPRGTATPDAAPPDKAVAPAAPERPATAAILPDGRPEEVASRRKGVRKRAAKGRNRAR